MSTTESDASSQSVDGDDLADLDYSSAVAELDDILLELEDEALDVDVLAERVERASVLIRFCRTRITSARTQVEQIVADLEELGDDE